MTVEFIRLVQTEFNEEFKMDFDNKERVRCPNLEALQAMIVIGNFKPDNISMPG